MTNSSRHSTLLSAQSSLRVLGASKRQAFPSPGLFVLRPFCPTVFLSTGLLVLDCRLLIYETRAHHSKTNCPNLHPVHVNIPHLHPITIMLTSHTRNIFHPQSVPRKTPFCQNGVCWTSCEMCRTSSVVGA